MSDQTSWQLGSDFDSDSAILCPDGKSQPVPWADSGEPISYVESGRQAISLLVSTLAAQGRNRVLMPNHYCDSMIEPFIRAGWVIDFCEVGKDWTIAPPLMSLKHPGQTLIFSLAFFGVTESPDWVEFLRDASTRGALVMSDESHRVLGKGLALADFRVASLRKMLPVPDGAFLVGLEASDLPGGRQGHLRAGAMRAKSHVLRLGEQHDYLSLFHEAEEETKRCTTPSRMSTQALFLVERLDYDFMQQRRVANARFLTASLGSGFIRVSNGHAPVASHAVLSTHDVPALRKFLVSRKIFPPIHWPAPDLAPRPSGPWRNDVVSIPIDHRYSPDDIDRVVAAVREFESEQRRTP